MTKPDFHRFPSAAQRQLELAYKHTSSAWFPVNPTTLSTLKSRLAQGEYEGKERDLIEDIKTDFSLYLYCFRELTALSGDHDQSQTNAKEQHERRQIRSLVDLLELNGTADLCRILEVGQDRISCHSINDMDDLQANRLRESIFSTTTVETLSDRLEIDRNCGFTCALIRQLGLTLIAWNYPHIYRRAMESHTSFESPKSKDFDSLLESSLGFSPALLGMRFANRWGLADDVVAAVVPGSSSSSLPGGRREKSRESRIWTKLCAVGEAFARANSPRQNPSARRDWEASEQVIRRHLGPDGVQDIYRKTRKLSAEHAQYAPEALTVDDSSVSSGDGSAYAQRLFERNVYLRGCSPAVRKSLAGAYTAVEQGKISQEQLRIFVHEILPGLGFDSICVFMLDPLNAALKPVLKVGTPHFVKIRPVSIMNRHTGINPVASAYFRKSPLIEEGLLAKGIKKTFIAGTLGEEKRPGVLYLEVSVDAPPDTTKDRANIFRAIVQCLNDLLQLE